MTDSTPTKGLRLFQPDRLDQPEQWRLHYKGLEYEGEVLVVKSWRPELGNRLPRGLYFRIVFLTESYPISRSALKDRRIAVVVPGQDATEYVRKMNKEYGSVWGRRSTWTHRQGSRRWRWLSGFAMSLRRTSF